MTKPAAGSASIDVQGNVENDASPCVLPAQEERFDAEGGEGRESAEQAGEKKEPRSGWHYMAVLRGASQAANQQTA